ncbi:putative methyltransferase NSUN7 isoform X3 [Caretta caretta]|uniref:putative methyltransferase NSUN7 isoform X3 n=1 Tax=Caretta caretta TaxID=8467 RepID=UPI00209635C3|nr:putative methyltransferase NSUN7 isoform X3 [Caretta caretta]
MPSSKSNFLLSSDLSNFQEMAISNEREPTEKSTASLIENNGYQDSVYINAAKIFQGIRNEKPQDKILVRYGNELVPSLPDFKDECSQRSSYELAFSALKYQDLLENILLDSCFYPCQSIPDELTSLIVVMLYDLQDRKFQARQISEEEESIPEVRDIERYLYSFKTKLAAALARCRIKHDALSIEYILPETLRKQEQRASALPLYAWINTLKSSLEDIYKELKKEGFTKVESVSDFEGYTYCLDKHCHDVLVFPASLKEEILNLELFTSYKLILQDKSRSLAVHSVKALLNMDDDIIVAHMGSRLTAAHMSVLSNQSTSKVFVCGVKSQAKEVELKELFTRMECGNAGLLRDLSQGSVAENKLHILAERQLQELMHAMRFNKVQAIVYCTCSVYPEENDAVLNKALESGVEGSKAQPYRLSPSLWCNSEIEGPSDIFFKMEPSEISNCCFLAVLARQRDPAEVMSVQDILARAAAKGLLEGLDIGKSSKREEKRKKKSKVTQQRNVPKDTGVQTNIIEFLNREMINTNSEVSPIKAISGPQKNVNQTNSSIQRKKMTKPISNSSLPGMLKNTPNLSSMSKVFERRTHIRKPRAEDKMVVLKPVEIVLPPVMVPYFNPQGNKSQISAQHYYYRWIGVESSAPDLFIPSLSKKLVKPKETLPSTMVKHPRPWI